MQRGQVDVSRQASPCTSSCLRGFSGTCATGVPINPEDRVWQACAQLTRVGGRHTRCPCASLHLAACVLYNKLVTLSQCCPELFELQISMTQGGGPEPQLTAGLPGVPGSGLAAGSEEGAGPSPPPVQPDLAAR